MGPRSRILVIAETLCFVPELRAFLEKGVKGAEISFREERSIGIEALVRMAHGVSGLVVGKEKMTRDLLKALPDLKLIVKYGVGQDNLDLEACKELGIEVRSGNGVNADSVAEHTLGLMIGLLRKIAYASRQLHDGKWDKNGGTDLRGKVVGIVGCGHIGSRVARLATAFGSSVLINDIADKSSAAKEIGAKISTFDEIVENADIISLHVPLTPQTYHLIHAGQFAKMGPRTYIVNTSRGAVIDQEALKNALKQHLICGAALDVYETEPLVDKELYSLDNFVGTPHIAAGSIEARQKMAEFVRDALRELS
jgi:D-3-phosphoglycerate dehydrogenase